jgi:hypothetical protein
MALRGGGRKDQRIEAETGVTSCTSSRKGWLRVTVLLLPLPVPLPLPLAVAILPFMPMSRSRMEAIDRRPHSREERVFLVALTVNDDRWRGWMANR